jgi:exodeoxyribonuclease VII large subunit
MSNKRVIEVNALVRYLKDKTNNDFNLLNLSLSGELSNLKQGNSKHLYFDLKDDKAAISGIIFSNNLANLNTKLQNGDKVIVTGSIKVYELNSKFQIIATDIIRQGIGELFALFEKNKRLLKEKGYFDSKYKQTITKYPKMIAIIAGNNTAALKDILKTINTRYKLVKVVVFPSLVQGNNALDNIISNLELINRYPFDTIILARGGGSFGDLNVFNDVNLCLSIFNSKIPINTGMGPETDYTIAD